MKQNIKDLLYNILTSNTKSTNPAFLYKLLLLNSFLIFGGTALFITFIYWLLMDNIALVIIDFIASGVFWILLFALRTSKNIPRIVLASSIATALACLVFLHVNKTQDIGIVWAYITIIYLILLNGYKKGSLLALIFYCLLSLDIYFYYNDWVEVGWSGTSTLRFTITSLLIALLANTSEYTFSNLQKKFSQISNTDPLTEISNRRKLDATLDYELKKQQRLENHLSLAIMDVDNFKSINDTFGHSQGDSVLKKISQILILNIREMDTVGRWGGEEFCIIFPSTSLENAVLLLERIREEINKYDFHIPQKITCSFGVSCSTGLNTNADKLITMADDALYEAKENGKNRVAYRL